MNSTAEVALSAEVGSWEVQLEEWLAPFQNAFRRRAQRHWAPVYLRGLLGPGDRKSIEPMAARVAPDDTQQLHHFVCTSSWETAPLETVLARKADALLGGEQAHLIIDDTALVKKGEHSVGVAQQYCGQLGKNANCQALVSLTLAKDEVPLPLVLRLYLPESWASDLARRQRAGIPASIEYRPKWRIALDELDRVRAAGTRFGDVLSDAGYGACAKFRAGLSERGLRWAVGVPWNLKVYPNSVRLIERRAPKLGRRPTHPRPSRRSITAKKTIARLGEAAFRTIAWRDGTKGELKARYAAVRVRVADGPHRRQPLPGQEAWLVCERRTSGVTKYHLTNHPPDTTLEQLATCLKARWACEQAHQQLKEELGLDHFEGRSWSGLHHHTLMTLIAFAFLQNLRLAEKKRPNSRTSTISFASRGATTDSPCSTQLHALPPLWRESAPPSTRMKVAE